MSPTKKKTKEVQQLDIEKVVLGACILDTGGIVEAGDRLHSKCFSISSHQKIYEAILSIKNKKGKIDPVVVIQEMRDLGTLAEAGNEKYIVKLSEVACDLSVLSQHAQTLHKLALRRKTMGICREVLRKSEDTLEDISHIIGYATKEFLRVNSGASFSKTKNLEESIRGIFESWKDKESVVSTGYKLLDSIIGGYGKGDLVVVAGRTGMGKTTFMVNLATKLIENTIHKCLFFTLEMRGQRIVESMLMNLMGIESQRFLSRNNMGEDMVDSIMERTHQMRSDDKMYINDASGISIDEIRSICRKKVYSENIRVVFVDYLQLVSVENCNPLFNREQVVSHISRGLKELAKELDITIITGSQLNRKADADRISRPMLSSLRESGSIEQEADVILMLFRPEGNQMEVFKNGDNAKDKAELIVGKNRRGCTPIIRFRSPLRYARFEEEKILEKEDDIDIPPSELIKATPAP